MKIFLRILLALVGVLLLVAIVGISYFFIRYPDVPPAPSVKIEATPERLARGKYLNNHVVGCTTCHGVRDWTRFAGPVTPGSEGRGGDKFDLGPAGVLYAKNITPAAIGSWSDGELLHAVTAGVSRDGTPLFPLMPYPRFGRMSEDDVHSVVAYVRTVSAIEGTVPDRTLNPPMNLIVRTIPSAPTFRPRPSPDNKVAYGQYMINAALCSECHTPIDDQGQPLPGRDYAGGLLLLETGYRVHTANITPDADTGIGSWTEQQFVDKFKSFEGQTGTALSEAERRQNTPMPWTAYAGMTREDLAAIYAYLRTVKPVVNRVNKFPDANADSSRR